MTDPVFLGTARRTSGRALTALGRFEEAEERLSEAYELLEPELGAQHRQTRTTADALGDLYEAWGLPEEVAIWRERGTI